MGCYIKREVKTTPRLLGLSNRKMNFFRNLIMHSGQRSDKDADSRLSSRPCLQTGSWILSCFLCGTTWVFHCPGMTCKRFLREQWHQKGGSPLEISRTLHCGTPLSFWRFFKEGCSGNAHGAILLRLQFSGQNIDPVQCHLVGEGRAWQGGGSGFQPCGWDSSKQL